MNDERGYACSSDQAASADCPCHSKNHNDDHQRRDTSMRVGLIDNHLGWLRLGWMRLHWLVDRTFADRTSALWARWRSVAYFTTTVWTSNQRHVWPHGAQSLHSPVTGQLNRSRPFGQVDSSGQAEMIDEPLRPYNDGSLVVATVATRGTSCKTWRRVSRSAFNSPQTATGPTLRLLRATWAATYMHYNFCRVHRSLRVTPAMEAGVTDHVWTLGDVVEGASR